MQLIMDVLPKIQLERLLDFRAVALLILVFAFVALIQPVAAVPVSVEFDSTDYGLGDTAYVDVTDNCVGLAPGLSNTASVLITSTSDPIGVTLKIPQISDTPGNCEFGGPAINFPNSGVIFTNSTAFPVRSFVKIDVSDPGFAGPAHVTVTSTSDPTGKDMSLVTLAPGQFTGRIFLGYQTGGNTIQVAPGDIVKIDYYGEAKSLLVSPNIRQSVGGIKAHFLDTLTATYGTVSNTIPVTIDLSAIGGGGGGGPLVIRPGFVLDGILGIGGSAFIVTPPSFGGGLFHYSDGLTIVKPNETYVFDISKYFQDIEDQVLVAGQPVNMTFKMYDPYNINAIIHTGLYFIPSGSDMITPNSMASIAYDKGSQIEINDPTKLFSDASVTTSTDEKFQYFSFYFVPTRSYEKMSFLARSWNDHKYSTDVIFHDAAIPLQKLEVLPMGFTKYDNFHDLITMLDKEGFEKPMIMAHIHGTADVFPSNEGGTVYWLYDSVAPAVTMVISDKEENTLFSFTQPLIKKQIQPEGDYGFMKFTVKQLNRGDVDGEQKIMKEEELKAMEKEMLTEGYHQENGVWIK